MIDFQNAKAIKLSLVDNSAFADKVTPMMIEGEEIVQTFKAVRDGVVFTTKRIFVINVQGMTGKKIDYTSLPTARFRLILLRLLERLTLTASWSSGSLASAK